LTIADPKLYRKILVDDFNNFEDLRWNGSQSRYLRKLLPSLRGEKWRSAKGHVIPSFSSDSINKMESLINESLIEFVDALKVKVQSGTKKIDMRK
jgi:hypothetical protein